MFDELLNGTTPIMSKSSAVPTADAPDQRQQQNTTSSTSKTIVADTPPLNIHTTPVTTREEQDLLFDKISEDTLDYIETEDAQDVGRTRDVVDEEKENDEDVLSTAQQKKEGTDDQNEGTDEQSKGTDDHTEERSATQTTQPPTSIIFRDDETIAQ
ncbi:hypothetical protein Tco_1549856, partial [Tanacetum coccineum]